MADAAHKTRRSGAPFVHWNQTCAELQFPFNAIAQLDESDSRFSVEGRKQLDPKTLLTSHGRV